jgi:hypothetical protein
MAKVSVCFRPAHIDIYDGHETIVVSIGLANPPRVHTFEARTAKEIRAKIDELGAQEHSVRAFARLEEGVRKPPGFDALMRNLNYNLETRIH